MRRDFIAKEYNWFLETYDAYPYPIQRADALRYFVVYHYGGIYADLDLQVTITWFVSAASLLHRACWLCILRAK